jgi:hypothetical protein
MSFFKTKLTELEQFQKEIEANIRNNNAETYTFEEEFIEVKVGDPNANYSINAEQLPSESNENISSRRGN